MYLQIRRRKIKKEDGNTLEFVLLQSVWEKGTTKKKFKKYLGSIKESNIRFTVHQVILWEKINSALSVLELSEEERHRFTTLLCQVVPQPTTQERQAYFDRRALALARREAQENRIGKPGRKPKSERTL